MKDLQDFKDNMKIEVRSSRKFEKTQEKLEAEIHHLKRERDQLAKFILDGRDVHWEIHNYKQNEQLGLHHKQSLSVRAIIRFKNAQARLSKPNKALNAVVTKQDIKHELE